MNKAQASKSFAWSVLFSAVNKAVLPLAVTVLIIRKLPVATMGIYGLLVTILTVVEVFRDAGLSQTYIAERTLTPESRRCYALLAFGFAAVPAVVLMGISPWLGPLLNVPTESRWTFFVVSGVLLVNGLLTIPTAELQRQNRFKEYGTAETFGGIVSYAISLAMVYAGFGLIALVTQLALRAVLNLAAALFYSPHPGWGYDSVIVRTTLTKARSVLGSMVLAVPFGLVDNLLISAKLGTVPLGLYTQTWNIAVKPADLVAFPLGRTLYVAFSRKNDDPRALSRTLTRSLSAVSLFVTPVYILLGIFAHPIFVGLLSKKYEAAVPILQILCLYFSFRSLGTLAGSALVAADRAATTIWCWLAAYTVVGVMLAARWAQLDVIWVASAFCAGSMTVYCLMLAAALRQFRPDRKELSRLLACLCLDGLLFGLCTLVVRVAGNVGPSVFLLVLGVLLAHVAGIGMVLASNPLAFYNRKGARALYEAL